MRSVDSKRTKENDIFRFNRQQKALNAVNHYFNLNDKVFYQNLPDRKNIRIERIVFLQSGITGKNEHYHFIANSPMQNAEEFCRLLKAMWERCIRESSSRSEFEVVENNVAVANYLMHEYGKLGNDTFNVITTHLNAEKVAVRNDSEYTSRVKMRVLRRVLKTKELELKNAKKASNYI